VFDQKTNKALSGVYTMVGQRQTRHPIWCLNTQGRKSCSNTSGKVVRTSRFKPWICLTLVFKSCSAAKQPQHCNYKTDEVGVCLKKTQSFSRFLFKKFNKKRFKKFNRKLFKKFNRKR